MWFCFLGIFIQLPVEHLPCTCAPGDTAGDRGKAKPQPWRGQECVASFSISGLGIGPPPEELQEVNSEKQAGGLRVSPGRSACAVVTLRPSA